MIDIERIIQTGNAFYQYMIDNGEVPMSMEVFKERKKVINELSKEQS